VKVGDVITTVAGTTPVKETVGDDSYTALDPTDA